MMVSANKQQIDFQVSKQAAMILYALSNPLRQQLLKLINEHQNIIVTDIYVKLRITQSDASMHLSILRKTNLVVSERSGRMAHYSVNNAYIVKIADLLNLLKVDSETEMTTWA